VRANDVTHLLSADTPREAPWTLPDPADSGFVCEGWTRPADVRDDLRPVNSALRGFIQLAAILDARVRPDRRVGIADRTRAVQTQGEAREYLVEVATRLRAVGLGGGSEVG